MAHFFHLPEPKNVHVPDPRLTSLSLRHTNGTASMGVWGISQGYTVRAENNPRFVSARTRLVGIVGHFYLTGLVKDDKIAAFDGSGNQQTAWLPITFSAGDKGQSVVIQSKQFTNVKLDARGSNQGFYPMAEQDWLDWVERCLTVIKRNPVGQTVLATLAANVTIVPFLPNDRNADANAATNTIRFTPKAFGGFEPGARPNEILFHEFCHLADGGFGGYTNSVTPSFNFGGGDFFSVTATNVYIAKGAEKRALRHDWSTGFKAMAAPYNSNAAAYRVALLANFNTFNGMRGALRSAMAAQGGPWNPF